ncbi:MAG: hypothetical protein ACFFD4_09310 [Candidatus Odinarchaeota archaeon]
MVKKTIDFPDETDYLRLAGDAKANKQTIGEFIINNHKFWKKHIKE